MSQFPAVRIEGGLLGPETLEQLLAGDLPGQKPKDFGLDGRRSLTDEIASVFADARAEWEVFQRRLERLPEGEPATSLTRDAWMIPFLSLLGYELRYNPCAYEVDGETFAISHRAGEPEDAPPVHIVGARQELGRLAPTGRPRLAPHSLVQQYLNRSEQLWGLVTNGLTLRLLRDSTYVRRQAYVEFDLRQIFEEQRFADFAVLYRLLHRTRLPRAAEDARDCLLEEYYKHAVEQGGRVRERLRDGVEECIRRLANGFLAHPANTELRQRIASSQQRAAVSASGERPAASGVSASPPTARCSLLTARSSPLAPEDLYRELLRLVYRLLFLLVSEDRGLISGEEIYREHYGVARLRRLLDRRSAYTEHDDIWCSLRVLWKVLCDEQLATFLGAPPLNGELFERIDLDHYTITNRDFLEAFWHLAYYRESSSAPPRRVNYAALDVEELGSVYESLLEYHPQIDTSGGLPRFELAFGSERKSTGSYYTPPELVAELIRSALEPVIAERLASSERRAASSDASELTVEEKRDVYSVVSRPPSMAERHGLSRASLPTDPVVSQGGTLRTDLTNPPSSDVHSGEHRGRMGPTDDRGISTVPAQRPGQLAGTGNPFSAGTSVETGKQRPDPAPAGNVSSPGAPTDQPSAQPFSEKAFLRIWQSLPITARRSLLAAHALLSVRVLDPACGSGHFLLAAARRLGKELAKIRTGEDEPAPERVREAIRDVVGHCIYGVDKNPLAVELCRVALWLEAHCAGKPLTFLDHRIRCGDSLVGVLDLDALKAGIPDDAFAPVSTDAKATANLLKKRNRSERRDLESGQMRIPFAPEHVVDALGGKHHAIEAIADDSPAAVREKKNRYDRLLAGPERLRLAEACDLWTAAFFQRLTPELAASPAVITTDAVTDRLAGRAHPQALAAAQALAGRHRFFHWPLEFPEVFVGGGFDAVIGNPPFMGGLKISGNLGDKYRHWLEVAFEPYGGTADLCAAFYRRAYSLLKPGGRMGLVATNTIGQGDTRESGLAVILRQGGVITFAKRFIKWPGAANVEVNLVAIRKRAASSEQRAVSPILDGQPVPSISSRLDAEPEAEPARMPQNDGKAFIGDTVVGIGFVLESEEAEALLAKDSRFADCLFPYLNGEDLNSHPEQQPSRWVICFHDWDLERARQYPDLLRIVEERVKPQRLSLPPHNATNRKRSEYWWQFGVYAQNMRQAIAPLRRVLVRSRVSELHGMVFVPPGWIYNEQLIVFAFDDDYHFALLQSNIHEAWVWRQASSLESRNRYTPTDCFDTFPFPPEEYRRVASGEWRVVALDGPFAEAARIGAEYHEHRRQIMLRRCLGLTKTYNLFHDPNCTDADIVRLRELHAEMDRAILACYAWQDLDLGHGFWQNDRGQTRYTVSPEARRELLRRLLELNAVLATEVAR
jgi:hypothetical protein